VRVEGFLRGSEQRYPGKLAIVAGERRVTYGELGRAAARLALDLRRRGISRGDRVVILLDNSPETVISLFGVLRAGAVFSIVNPGTKLDKLAYILNNCGARALITEPRLLGMASEAAKSAPSVAFTLVTPLDLPSQGSLEEEEQKADPGIDLDLAMIVYTSGSTGFPKGVMMTHQNVAAAAASITTYLESAPEDVVLSVLPLAFDYGLYQALMCAKVGATLVLEKSFTYPAVLLETMKRERVTGLPLVPTIAAVLLQMKDLVPGMFPDLRYITNTAAALPPAHIARLQQLFPATRIFSMYGLTECKRCTYLPPEQLAVRPGSVGIAIPGTEAYVVDDAGRKLAAGMVGELVIRGAHVMKGYWGDPQASERALKPGPFPWEKVLHTGDLFKADAQGYLYFVGRKDDIIKSRGEKVAPKEVENVLYEMPGVREAAVIGVPDPVLGMAIKAVVALEAGVTLAEREVIRHCARRLEEFMVPKYVEFRDALPKSHNGKISRSQVAQTQVALP
jgi:amino acid adenylation domain-containing protein